jgi:hypothetical protein
MECAMAKGILLSWLATDHDPYYSEHKRGAFCERADGLLPGPSLCLATDVHYGPRISRYIVFHQSEHAGQAVALRTALKEARASLWPDREFEAELIDMGTFRPIDHGAIWRGLSFQIGEILKRYPPSRTWGPGAPLWNFAYQHLYWDRSFDESNPDHLGDLEREAPAWVRQEQERWQREQEQGHDYLICISQGTPAMHAIWLVLVQAEIIRATLLQTIPPRYRTRGESCALPVSLDVGKLPMPIVQDIKRSGIQEQANLEKIGGVAVLSHFMRANVYPRDQSYGLYRLTHTGMSQSAIEETLRRIDRDLEDVAESLSTSTKGRVEQYIRDARTKFNEGLQRYEEWVAQNSEALKGALRFSFKEWIDKVRNSLEPSGITVECELREDASMPKRDEVYCDADVVQRGLCAIVENMVKHGYSKGEENRSLKITISRNNQRCQIVLEDQGRGFRNPRDHFQMVGDTGAGVPDIKLLRTWFQINIEATSKVTYNLNDNVEKTMRESNTGTRYVLTCRLPPTKTSAVSE